MPLLCIRCLLALLLLPLALSCDKQKIGTDLANSSIVGRDLKGATESINDSLQNRTCHQPKHRHRDCTSDKVQDKEAVILTQICKMDKLGLNETERLIQSLTYPTNCSCEDLPTIAPTSRGRKKILCKVKVILAAMTECFQMLRDRNSG